MAQTDDASESGLSAGDIRRGPLAIAGAGAAGMAAAIAAARCGRRVYLIESAARPGGTVAEVLIHTLAGLYDSAGQVLQQGLGQELIERLASRDPTVGRRRMGRLWVLSACPSLYRAVVEQWIAGETNITLLTSSRVAGVTRSGGRITSAEVLSGRRRLVLQPAAVVDATGTGDVVRLLDASLLQDDGSPAAGGMIFRLRGIVPGSLAFPRGARFVHMLRAAAGEAALPPTCAHAWIDTGLREDEAFVKLLVPLPADWRDHEPEITREAHQVQAAVVAFLRRLPPFARASVAECGRLGVRDGGRVRGEYCLTADDVRQMRKFDDAACRGCWPIEYWDAARGVSLEYLPADDYYEIPLRSLKVQGLANVWVAGKCLSADARAQASARVAGTCWAMGEAAGKAAADFCRPPTEGSKHECRSLSPVP
jgi:hypothetical protein